MNQSKNNQLKENVLEKIKKNQVHMRPKLYFAAKILILIVVIAATLLCSAFLVSYIFFSIQVSNKLFLLGYGVKGILAFFELFPWFILAGVLLLILLLEWLLHRFQFAYHRPIIYLLLVCGVASFLLGLILNATPLNMDLLKQNTSNPLPLIGGFYEHVERPSEKHDVFRGTISSITGNLFIVEADDHDNDQDDGIRKVIVTPQMENTFHVGDKVFIAGDLDGDQIQAYGMSIIQTIDQDETRSVK